ncbi:MAG TPA: hypothetical protein ENI81_06320 [Phycisphaerales bacterium]|nr:hypothetical protein [Phycisphaerales bacterium]
MPNASRLTLVDYQKVVESFRSETDRAAAVLTASFTECFLEKLLRIFMRDDSSVDDLFRGHGPLSTFSSRSDCAYAFEIIDQDLHRDLKFIRKVRNHFAHHPSEAAFSDGPVKDFCAQLSTSTNEKSPRTTFLIAVGLAIGTMHNIMLKKEKARCSED